MEIINQCCSKEQGIVLAQMGIELNPVFSHFEWKKHTGVCLTKLKITHISNILGFKIKGEIKLTPAYSLAELGEMLPSEEYTMYTGLYDSQYCNWEWRNDDDDVAMGLFSTEAQARADRLIILIQKGELTVDEINKKMIPF